MDPYIDAGTLDQIRVAVEATFIEKITIQRMKRVPNGRGGWADQLAYAGEFPARLDTPHGRLGERVIAEQLSERVPYRINYPTWVGIFPPTVPPGGTMPDPPPATTVDAMPHNPGDGSVWFTNGDRLKLRGRDWDVQAVEMQTTIGVYRTAVIWLRLIEVRPAGS